MKNHGPNSENISEAVLRLWTKQWRLRAPLTFLLIRPYYCLSKKTHTNTISPLFPVGGGVERAELFGYEYEGDCDVDYGADDRHSR